MAILEEAIMINRRVGSSPRRVASPLGRKRLALQKGVKNETELYIPRAYLWKKGNVIVRGVYTGIPLLAINYETSFQNHLQPKQWLGENTVAQIAEIDPISGRVGRISGLIRREETVSGEVLRLYTYFPSFDGQGVSFTDKEFCQNTMFHYGEFVKGSLGRKHSFSRVMKIANDQQPCMKTICNTRTGDISRNPIKRIAHRCKGGINIELHDPKTGDIQFSRDQTTEITTIARGQNMLVGVCLSFVMDFMANPSEGEL